MTSPPSAVYQELEKLGESLCRSVAANRYEEAQQLVDRCLDLHTSGNHQVVLAILERARRLAIVQRSLAPQCLARLKSAIEYASGASDPKRYIASG